MIAGSTFVCKKLKLSITPQRCIRNQREALQFWGPEASKFNSCPCKTGLEIQEEENGMAKRGKCTNCGREPLNIIGVHNLCSSCYTAAGDKTGEYREAALKDAAIRLNDPKNGRSVNSAKRRMDGDEKQEDIRDLVGVESLLNNEQMNKEVKQTDEVKKVYVDPPIPVPVPWKVISLAFVTDADMKLYEKILSLAALDRRVPDQEIMIMLEAVIEGTEDGRKSPWK